MSTPAVAADQPDQTLRCARHPGTETVLRCGRCETPICPKCLVATPVGARCPTCARVKRVAFLIKPRDAALATLYGLLVAGAGGLLVRSIPFLGFLGLAVLGFLVGEVVSRGANRKRAPELGVIAIACLFVGFALGPVILLAFSGSGERMLTNPSVIVGVLVAPFFNLFTLLGLLVGALLAWMRVR